MSTIQIRPPPPPQHRQIGSAITIPRLDRGPPRYGIRGTAIGYWAADVCVCQGALLVRCGSHAQVALRALAQLTLLMVACPPLGNSKGKHMGRGGRYAERDVAGMGNGKRVGWVIDIRHRVS